MKINVIEKVEAYEIPLINFMFGIIGLLVIWNVSHNFWALLGGLITGLHLRFRVKK